MASGDCLNHLGADKIGEGGGNVLVILQSEVH